MTATAGMTGRTCLITGGSSGIGRATAAALVERGANLVILGRDEARLQRAATALESSRPGATVDWVSCDLASLESVRAAATEIRARAPELHVLVNNAGVWLPERRTTVDGIEETFQVNYLSHFLLTHLLLDNLRAGAPARIVNVASTHRGAKLQLDDLMLERGYSTIASMSRTKLALILFTKSLARQLAGTRVTVNSLHPGLAKTGLTSGLPWFVRVTQRFASPPEKAAATSVYLASSPEVEGVSGQFFIKCRPAKTVGQANDPRVEQELWEVSRKLASLDV